MRTRRTAVRLAVVAAVIALASTAGAAAKLPAPGSAAQVAALVAASSSIKVLPSNLVPPLSQVPTDDPGTYYGSAGRTCAGVTKCVWGDKTSKELVVLYGDSHAEMWLPAIVPVATEHHFRLSLVWMSGCPAATVSVWDASTHSINKACNTFRKKMLAQIKAADPVLVLTADRTSDIPGAGNKLISDAVWKAGLETTISELKDSKTSVAVVGDVTAFSTGLPGCLASDPTDIQSCSVPNPNPKTHQHFAAEQAAASAEHVSYLNPQPWLCTTVCSPVIGNMAAYWDDFHVTSTYAEYLSVVWGSTLVPLLPT